MCPCHPTTGLCAVCLPPFRHRANVTPDSAPASPPKRRRRIAWDDIEVAMEGAR